MAVNLDHLDLMRQDLAGARVTETKMFGGICFLTEGRMICGLHKDGAMYRVGHVAEPLARALPGTAPMLFTGKPMRGFVDANGDALADDATRQRLTELALAYARSQPAK